MEAVIQKIEDAAAVLLEADGSIKRWCVGRVEAREKRTESIYTGTNGST